MNLVFKKENFNMEIESILEIPSFFLKETSPQLENYAEEEESEMVEGLLFFLSGFIEEIPSFIPFDCSFFQTHFENMKIISKFISK